MTMTTGTGRPEAPNVLHALSPADSWGPLAEPLHDDAAGPGDPIWKDNAYLSFWDVSAQVFGTLHLSTSPNGEGSRRARCSLFAGGEVVEIIEPLERGSFTSESIDFGFDGTVTVTHPDLSATLVNAPLFTPADYAVNGLIPELVPGKPLQHFQQACTVSGSVTVRGRQVDVDGFGMRDRTWGFRDEAAQWVEYAGLIAVFDGSFVTAMKFLGADGAVRSDGFLITEQGAQTITGIAFRRTSAAQFLRATLEVADGTTHTVTMTSREAGFFVPMGAETDGPAFGTYDDFMQLESDGRQGAGLFEQGIVHRVF